MEVPFVYIEYGKSYTFRCSLSACSQCDHIYFDCKKIQVLAQGLGFFPAQTCYCSLGCVLELKCVQCKLGIAGTAIEIHLLLL